jgi:hypothetical protein
LGNDDDYQRSPDRRDAGPSGQIADLIKAQLQGQQRAVRECLTPEEAASPSGGFDMGQGACKFEQYEMKQGRLTALGKCADPQQGEMTMRVSGSFTPQQVDSTQDVFFNAPGGAGNIAIKMGVMRKRVGECPRN